MNQEKARDYFSAYYEGSLERGLRTNLEQRLRADGQLQAEYRAFERTMEQLDLLKFETIDVPIYLSDRIATRLEGAMTADRVKSPLLVWLNRYAIAGLAAAALIGAAYGIFSVGHGRNSQASVFDGTTSTTSNPASENVTVSTDGSKVHVAYQSATPRRFKVLDSTGQTLNSFDLTANQSLTTDLTNANPQAAIFEIQVGEQGPDEWIAVPGSQPAVVAGGSGSVQDFAIALADHYKVPVILASRDHDKTIAWTLSGATAYQAAQKALDGSSYDATQTASNVVSISDR